MIKDNFASHFPILGNEKLYCNLQAPFFFLPEKAYGSIVSLKSKDHNKKTKDFLA